MLRDFRSFPNLVCLTFLIGLSVLFAIAPQAMAQQEAGQNVMVLPDDPDKLVAHTAQGAFPFVIEIADNPSERARGLMFREKMPANHGMLFDFGVVRDVAMWMKNTPMALDMVFIRSDGTVSRVAERTKPYSEDVIDSGEPVSHVLELRAGIARMIGLKPGDRLEHPLFTGAKRNGTAQ
ncbi:MAG: DUF192 domain-containing protein [Salaquimonas sp.]|jgi:hypothetical protein|nr:DUF192 domain-containing protein [Salaquimonas sp.]